MELQQALTYLGGSLGYDALNGDIFIIFLKSKKLHTVSLSLAITTDFCWKQGFDEETVIKLLWGVQIFSSTTNELWLACSVHDERTIF